MACFECHRSTIEDLIPCSQCRGRAAHSDCFKTDAERKKELDAFNYHKQKFIAVYGIAKSRTSSPFEISKADAVESDSEPQICHCCLVLRKGRAERIESMGEEEVNCLLKYVVERVVSWIPGKTTGLKQIMDKVKNLEYTLLEELLVDILVMTHEIAVEKGVNSKLHQACRYLFVDALFEIDEIKQCPDCYRHSNCKADPTWFAKPCSRKRHELVYAKITGNPYWPAKVIKMVDDSYDVRFFGSKHYRSLCKPRYVKSTDCEYSKLNPKKSHTQSLQKALKEFELHKSLLAENPSKYSFEEEQKGEKITFSKMKKSKKTVKPQGRKRKKSPEPLSERSKAPKVDNNNDDCNMSKLLMLEKKQRTRGDIQKIIQGLHQDEEVVEELLDSNDGTVIALSTSSESELSSKSSKSTVPKMIAARPQNREQSSAVVKLRRQLEPLTDIEDVKAVAEDMIAREVEIWQQKVRDLEESHMQQISSTKKKMWCIACQKVAIYYCCWNISYCSKDCQHQHWKTEHKKTCKRAKKEQEASATS